VVVVHRLLVASGEDDVDRRTAVDTVAFIMRPFANFEYNLNSCKRTANVYKNRI